MQIFQTSANTETVMQSVNRLFRYFTAAGKQVDLCSVTRLGQCNGGEKTSHQTKMRCERKSLVNCKKGCE